MELWTAAHAKTLPPALLAMIVVAVLLRLTIGKKTLKIRMIPLQIIAVLLVALEIGKQYVSFQNGYDLYHIPLHYCSLFIFAVPAMAFYTGKGCEKVRAVGASFCGAMATLLLIYPNLIYGSWNIEAFFTSYLDMHTVAFHNLVLFAFVLIVALDLHTPTGNKEQVYPVWATVAFCVVSASAANILKVNYANFYQCNIAPLEAVRMAVQNVTGYVPAQILYACIVSALTVLYTWGAYWLYRLIRKGTAIKTPVMK
ncbi:MAG: YwaF family protein [Oscillospiraceae bacterium]|nr:YwaF family protein [Oscillospiraceae bacterium]MBQ9930376.1 YwaF family protein [Oscillospiraceae bacterium]